ncbi:hypothetical protein BS50DRAFT_640385 [Corynespora cassiicola Philippines]|uniref:Uncharacterized protein n=1 Tax=Corynespora cassiicola Philippines TaxID=1448308 RepID=A0A2T2N3D6_CORCC|nr:hypothetical protein BS50DRAFT_640385 [Corynespora cassiicola Philippines]
MRKCLCDLWDSPSKRIAIPELNSAELEDMEHFLTYLLESHESVFSAKSAITFAVADSLRLAKLDIATGEDANHEGQAHVTYHPGGFLGGSYYKYRVSDTRGLKSRALQIAWPRDGPEKMIEALGLPPDELNEMEKLWKYGSNAGTEVKRLGTVTLPFQTTTEVLYKLDEIPFMTRPQRRYPPHLGMLADQSFPLKTQKIHDGIDILARGRSEDELVWLHDNVSLSHVLRNEDFRPESQRFQIYMYYQALLFGFYYGLLEQFLTFELVGKTACFHGL